MVKKKLKLNDSQYDLVMAISKELDMSFRQTGEIIMAQGLGYFINNNKIIQKMAKEKNLTK